MGLTGFGDIAGTGFYEEGLKELNWEWVAAGRTLLRLSSSTTTHLDSSSSLFFFGYGIYRAGVSLTPLPKSHKNLAESY